MPNSGPLPRKDWSHACTECEWHGWSPPEINSEGEHLDPTGGVCKGAIQCTPPPTAEASTA